MSGPATLLTLSHSSIVIGSAWSIEMRRVRPDCPYWSSAYSSKPMWFRVGSSSSRIDGMGQVGMFRSRGLPYRTGPKGSICASLAANERIDRLDTCFFRQVGALQAGLAPRRSWRRSAQRLQSPPDDQERRRVEDRAVGARHDADHQGERKTLKGRPAGDEVRGLLE